MYTYCRLHKAVSHPHLVQLYSVFEDPNFVYIVLELCRFVCLFVFGWLYNLLFVCLTPLFCLHCHWALQAPHHFYTSPLCQKHVREIFCMLTITHKYTSPGMEAYVSWYRGGKLSQSLKPDILFNRSIKFSLQTGSVFLWYRGSLIVTHSSISFFAKEKVGDWIPLMQQFPDPNGLQVSAWQQDHPQVDWKSTNRTNYTILSMVLTKGSIYTFS